MSIKVHLNPITNNRELHVSHRLNEMNDKSDHYGRLRIRVPEDHFKLQGPHGCHGVFYQQALGMSPREMQNLSPTGVFEHHHAQGALNQALPALEFLHSEANITHTGEFSADIARTISSSIFFT